LRKYRPSKLGALNDENIPFANEGNIPPDISSFPKMLFTQNLQRYQINIKVFELDESLIF